jgi:hypothetical protein
VADAPLDAAQWDRRPRALIPQQIAAIVLGTALLLGLLAWLLARVLRQ